jgi:ABC-type transport system involved in multi-copper enzyme maturation permease subunit
MPKYLLLVLGLFIPFIAAEGVARDLKRRTHEMLMSTQVPTWAYVLGRYAAVLVVTLSLALLLLGATLTVATALNVWLGYPAPNLAAILALWAVAVLPAVILVSSLSFAFGTLWPRHANSAKTVLVVLWVLAQFSAALWEHEQSPYSVIDPAGVVMTQVIQGPYAQIYAERISILAGSQAQGQSI